MVSKLEKELRKASFYVMAGHLENITGRMYLTTSEIATILKVSRPTAKKYMEKLIDEGKAVGHRGDKRSLVIMVYYSRYNTKEVDSAHRAYQNLISELTQ